ncbi:hypothetical protein [Branchiibius cervicis]|uniref:HTH hxlR-type domain-containing protein n=1 Tax=Branchiibius cervicis TaxID=908252 RepID=A0ABW2ATB1_9MICO
MLIDDAEHGDLAALAELTRVLTFRNLRLLELVRQAEAPALPRDLGYTAGDLNAAEKLRILARVGLVRPVPTKPLRYVIEPGVLPRLGKLVARLGAKQAVAVGSVAGASGPTK